MTTTVRISMNLKLILTSRSFRPMTVEEMEDFDIYEDECQDQMINDDDPERIMIFCVGENLDKDSEMFPLIPVLYIIRNGETALDAMQILDRDQAIKFLKRL